GPSVGSRERGLRVKPLRPLGLLDLRQPLVERLLGALFAFAKLFDQVRANNIHGTSHLVKYARRCQVPIQLFLRMNGEKHGRGETEEEDSVFRSLTAGKAAR